LLINNDQFGVNDNDH